MAANKIPQIGDSVVFYIAQKDAPGSYLSEDYCGKIEEIRDIIKSKEIYDTDCYMVSIKIEEDELVYRYVNHFDWDEDRQSYCLFETLVYEDG